MTDQSSHGSSVTRLELTRVREPETAVARTFEPGTFGGQDHPFSLVAPVDLRFTLYKDKERYRLAGRVQTAIELGCSRCLDPFRVAIDAPFDLRYLPESEQPEGGEGEVDDDDVSASYYRDDVIDLGQLVEEQIYLALPMKPLCRETCRGLCPQCGANLNTEPCACEVRWEDPRLAPLKALMSERKSNDA